MIRSTPLNDLARLGRWLRAEACAIAAWLAEPQLWALLVMSLLAWSLAYQSPYRVRLAVGGDPATRERRFDEPYLRGFNDSEPAADQARGLEWWQVATQPGAFPYRWAESQASVVMPGLGGGPWLLTLGASSGRKEPVEATLTLGDAAQPLVIEPGQPRRYSLAVPSSAGGDLELGLHAPRLIAPGDPRDLGFVVTGLALAPLPAGLRAPAWGTLLAHGLSLLLAYGLLRRLNMARRLALGAGLALALALAWLLAAARLPLTIFAPTLLWLAVSCYVLATIGAAFVPEPQQRARRARAGSLPGLRTRALVLVVVVGFALRLGGMLHPHVLFSDIGLNANNLRGTLQGMIFFSEGLPAEAGGGQAPYPPGQYLALAPLLLLLGTGGSGINLAIQAGNALLDSLLAGLIWLTLRRSGAGGRAALFGALLYLLPAPLLRSFSIGEFANIFGQGMAMLLLLGWLSGALRRVLPTACLILLALLSHLGVSISLACLLVCLLALWAAGGERHAARNLALAGMLAAALAVALYYSAFGELLAARLSGAPGGAAQGAMPGDALARLVRRVTRELRPGGALYPPLAALGLLGLLRYGGMGRRLPALLSAWWLGTLLSLGLLVVARQGVRWEHFLYPGLCLGGGLALALLARRGRAGSLAATLLVLSILWYGGELWYNQLRAYLH